MGWVQPEVEYVARAETQSTALVRGPTRRQRSVTLKPNTRVSSVTGAKAR